MRPADLHARSPLNFSLCLRFAWRPFAQAFGYIPRLISWQNAIVDMTRTAMPLEFGWAALRK